MIDKIVIYDFCQTLVDFETADEFVHFIHKKTNSKRMTRIEQFRNFLRITKIMWMMEKIISRFVPHYSVNKRIILHEIKGFSKTKIDYYANQYYEEVIKKHFITDVLELLIEQKKNGYVTVIVSASYEPILKLFQDEYGVDYLITNQFMYDNNGMFLGKMTREDCVGKNKVKRLGEIFDISRLKNIDSKSYGDSKSDIHILCAVKQGIVISNKVSKNWAKENSFGEMIWQ